MALSPTLPDSRIQSFILEHHVLTLATVQNNVPWCSHCFYVYDDIQNCLYVASDEHTRHVKEILENNCVAGAIVLETKTVGKIRGLQFTGIMTKPEGAQMQRALKKMLLRCPFAIISNTVMWQIQLKYAKVTDNRLGFGTKLIWE